LQNCGYWLWRFCNIYIVRYSVANILKVTVSAYITDYDVLQERDHWDQLQKACETNFSVQMSYGVISENHVICTGRYLGAHFGTGIYFFLQKSLKTMFLVQSILQDLEKLRLKG
jgi:hypothetical protein